jgi:hypothetical protein
MNYVSLAVALLLLVSCGSENKPATNDSVPAAVAAKPTVSEVQPYRPDISLMPWEGDLADAIYWRDSRGENAVVLSTKPQYFWEEENPQVKAFFPKGEETETLSELTEFFATHYVLKRGDAQWKVFSTYHDYLFGCCDVYMNYQPGSLQIVDADSNGTGEALFVYHQTEGDGMIEHRFTGTLVLELDSAYYTIKDATGLAAEIQRTDQFYVTADNQSDVPDAEPYSEFIWSKWEELYRLKVQQDRDELTDRNNVKEDGHTDHNH